MAGDPSQLKQDGSVSDDLVDDDDRGLIDRFLEMMMAERGAAKNTIAAYRTDLMRAAASIAGGIGAATCRGVWLISTSLQVIEPSCRAVRS